MKIASIVLVFMLVIAVGSACASTQPITEPVAVIEAFHEALSDGNLDAAMNFVADDAKFITTNVYIGKEQVRDFFLGPIGRNIYYELSDLNLQGDTVSGNIHGTDDLGEFDGVLEAVVQGGKIVYLMGDE